MYEVRDTDGFFNRYAIYRNGTIQWFTTTLPGAKQWIERDKAAREPRMVPADRIYPVVYREGDHE